MQITRIWHTVRLRLFPLIYRICVTCSVKRSICNVIFTIKFASGFLFLFSLLLVRAFSHWNSRSSLERCVMLQTSVSLKLEWKYKMPIWITRCHQQSLKVMREVMVLPYASLITHHVAHLGTYVGSSLKKNNNQVQDVMSDLVNQCNRNTLP